MPVVPGGALGTVSLPGQASPTVGPSIPHLAFPFHLNPDGTAATFAQDTTDDIAGCVTMIIGTRPGERTVLPTFGCPDQAFVTTGTSLRVAAAIAAWEPRAGGAAVTVTVTDDGVASVDVKL